MGLRNSLILTVALVFLAGAGYFLLSNANVAEAKFKTATVHLSPNCSCCVNHARYLKNSGVEVKILQHDNKHLQQMKNQMGIPKNYRSCHTTEVGDWIIEGHVPVEVINKVVEDQPEAEIISLPGMPSGSPGMPGPKTAKWIFHSISNGKVQGEFMTK